MDENGSKEYDHLAALCISILTSPHVKTDLEWGFSINKLLLKGHGTRGKPEIFESLSYSRDFWLSMEEKNK